MSRRPPLPAVVVVVWRCCRDWPITETNQTQDLCPRCGMIRQAVTVHRAAD